MKSPQNIADQLPLRRFEYKDDRSYKFWAIELKGNTHIVTFGRIGTKGQTRWKQFDNLAESKREYQKRIDEKRKAGYREVKKQETPQKSAEQIAAERAPHEPFLEAIIAADDDDLTPHLIYSDWLTERGDPLGEFIQVQIQLEDPNLPLRRRPELEKRETQLLARHVRGWLGNLAPFLIDQQPHPSKTRTYEFEFQRGQLTSIHVLAFSLAFGAALRESYRCRLLHDLTIDMSMLLPKELTVAGREPPEVRSSMRGANFENLRQLNLSIDTENISDFITCAQEFPRLQRLELARYSTILSEITAPRLKSARFYSLPADAAEALVETVLFRQLVEIEIADRLSADTAQVFASADAMTKRLERLKLADDTPSELILYLRSAGYRVDT